MMGCLALSWVVVLPLVLVVVKVPAPERAVAKRASEIFIIVWMRDGSSESLWVSFSFDDSFCLRV